LTEEFNEGGWANEAIDNRDILIPKLLLMHGQSELVLQGKRNIGEFIRSTDFELLAKRGETVDVIAIEKWKTWRVMKLVDKKYEWVREEPCTPENEDAEWDFTEDGQTMRRDKTMNFYALLAKDAQTGTAFPIKLSFARTSYKAGLKIADGYTRALMEKAPPTRQVFTIGSEFVNGDKDKYFIFTSNPGPATTPEQKATALTWKKVLSAAKAKNAIKDHDVDEKSAPINEATTEF